MIKKLFFLTFIFCSFISLVNASNIPTASDLPYWVTIGFIVVIIHITLVSLAYMYSNFFMSEDLKGWSKNEIMQAIYSIIILISFVGIFGLVNTIAESFFAQIIDGTYQEISVPDTSEDSIEGSFKSFCFNPSSNRWNMGDNCEDEYLVIKSDGSGKITCEGKDKDNCNPMFLMARSYLGIAFERLASLHQRLLINYALMNTLNAGGLNFGLTDVNFEFGANVGLVFMKDGVYINLLESLILFVEKILLALKFQESVLKFMEFGLAFYLIILGLIFRSIFFLRKLGGLMLSLGLCFMFVLPLLYVLGWYTLSIPNIEIVLDSDLVEAGGGPSNIAENWIFWTTITSAMAFGGFRVLEFFSLRNFVPAIIKTVFDTIILVGQFVMFVQYATNVTANSPDFYFTNYEVSDGVNEMQSMGAFDYISRFMIIALAIPLINVYIFFAFVRGLSPMLGGDAEIPALGRFL